MFARQLWLCRENNAFSCNESGLLDVQAVLSCPAGLFDGQTVIATQAGIVQLTDSIILHNILFVPPLKCNSKFHN